MSASASCAIVAPFAVSQNAPARCTIAEVDICTGATLLDRTEAARPAVAAATAAPAAIAMARGKHPSAAVRHRAVGTPATLALQNAGGFPRSALHLFETDDT